MNVYGIMLCSVVLLCAGYTYAETPDSITFTDGEQLAGKVLSVLGGNVTFHSDILGNVTVPLAKVKTMHSARAFAVIEPHPRLTRKTADAKVPVGTLALSDQLLHVTLADAEEKSFP